MATASRGAAADDTVITSFLSLSTTIIPAELCGFVLRGVRTCADIPAGSENMDLCRSAGGSADPIPTVRLSGHLDGPRPIAI